MRFLPNRKNSIDKGTEVSKQTSLAGEEELRRKKHENAAGRPGWSKLGKILNKQLYSGKPRRLTLKGGIHLLIYLLSGGLPSVFHKPAVV